MRAFAIAACLALVLAVGGFVYLLMQADRMAPTPSPQEVEVPLDLPR